MALDRRKIASCLQRELPRYGIDNPDAHRCAGIIWNDVVAHVKALKKEWKAEAKKAEAERLADMSEAPMTQEEREAYAAKILDGALRNNEMSIAELDRFKAELGLEAKGRDIKIEMVDFSKVYPTDADVYAVTAEVIRKGIEEANRDNIIKDWWEKNKDSGFFSGAITGMEWEDLWDDARASLVRLYLSACGREANEELHNQDLD